MISQFVFQTIFKAGVDSATKFLKEKKFKVDSSHLDLENAISEHIKQLSNWSKEITFKDLAKPKLTSKVFIDLEILLMPRKNRIVADEQIQSIPSSKLFNEVNNHLAILGQPGAGKTTLTKFICQSVFTDENFYPDEIKIPILVRLRDMNNYFKEKSYKSSPVINHLFKILGLSLSNKETDIKDEDFDSAKEKILIPILEELRCAIILDGYDEIAEEKNKEKVIEDFKKLALNLNHSRVILTSRSSDFNFSFENVSVLEICPLSLNQVEQFASKWLGSDTKTISFISDLKSSPFYDTAIRPLTLGHLCAIYERSGRIPDKPKTVYRKIINLLLEEWDEQRNVRRLTKYGSFEIDRKFEFLCRLSYELTLYKTEATFSKQFLKEIYNKIYIDFDLEKNEVNNVISEIESHTGLILESGYDKYEFAHKSIQEFLCAEHLVKLPFVPDYRQRLYLIPNELAIAVTISSNSSLYFCELVFTVFQHNRVNYSFISNFINRLVIEKPDFNVSEELSFALIVLYTIFIKGESNQLQLFNFDLPMQFEKFLNLIFERNKKISISEYYYFDKKDSIGAHNEILRLKRKFNGAQIGYYSLPEFIFIKEEFVSDTFEPLPLNEEIDDDLPF